MCVQCSLGEFLASTSTTMVDPLTGMALCEDGDKIPLTIENLGEFVELVATSWFDTGVRRQIDSFRAGINDVFPFCSLEVRPIHTKSHILTHTHTHTNTHRSAPALTMSSLTARSRCVCACERVNIYIV